MLNRRNLILQRLRLSALILILLFSAFFSGRYLLDTDIEYQEYQPFRLVIDAGELEQAREQLQSRFAEQLENIPRYITVEDRQFIVSVANRQVDEPPDPFALLKEEQYENIVNGFLDANPFALNVVGKIDSSATIDDVAAWYASEGAPTEDDARNLVIEKQRREHAIYQFDYGTHWSEVSKAALALGVLPALLFYVLTWLLVRPLRRYWKWISGQV